ncbi:HK97 family phage major capsid protein [Herbihabitans rhizosphaerae]|uniref:HK97 family phage major capsid protein n=1 Tax=Herbihabitans rhizosphaerae TaxID=1872711 RepID=A0A4Q7KRK4_9PSEU|nr:phage major capsid protein [Herbihabitans rhizosphaerae]RZS39144.1 HK97 family phage major capsid protein [Herbihabitans rhizosphaerae]
MAITAATKTTDFAGFLTPDESAPIFERAARTSVVQSLVQRIPLGINGQNIPYVTSKPTAGWVSEGGQKPTSKGAVGLKTIKPEKLAVIAVVSAEVVRANPAKFMSLLTGQIAEAFAIAFDLAAVYDKGPDGTAGGGPFATYLNQTTKAVELGTATQALGGVHADFNSALKLLVDDGKKLTGFALDDRIEPIVNGAVDTTGRPLYVEAPLEDTVPVARGGTLLRRRSFMGEGVGEPTPAGAGTYALGFAGDWSQAAWGAVGGISYDVSTQATVTINGVLTSLWEHNLVAVRAEAEYGFLVNDAASFVRLTETKVS